MTRQDLEQYPSLLKEIEWLKKHVKKIEKDHEAFMVADTVYGSTEANPQNRTITIRGSTEMPTIGKYVNTSGSFLKPWIEQQL